MTHLFRRAARLLFVAGAFGMASTCLADTPGLVRYLRQHATA